MLRRLLLLLLVAAGLVTAACGSPSNGGSAVTVSFVGNSTCPTDNASPYSPSPPDTNQAPVGQPIAEMPHTHVAPPMQVTYNHNPPTSGCHYSLGAGTAPISPGIHPASPTCRRSTRGTRRCLLTPAVRCPTRR